VRGYHGGVLVAVCLFWLLDRLAFWLPADLPQMVPLILHNAFLLLIVPLLLWTFLTSLDKIGKDNWYFILGLPLFIVSKNLMFFEQYFELAWTMSQACSAWRWPSCWSAPWLPSCGQLTGFLFQNKKWLDALIRLGIFLSV
jgi:uncharacterized protein involved in response to NO